MPRTVFVIVNTAGGVGAADWRDNPKELPSYGPEDKHYVVTVPDSAADNPTAITEAMDSFLGDYDLPEGWKSSPCHALHYTSADAPGADATWSVYREQYATVDDNDPIDGLTVRLSSHPSEAEADAEAGRLQTAARLEYLRALIRAERISYGEIAELQGLAEHIDPGDVELLQWAGVPEFGDESPSREPYTELSHLVGKTIFRVELDKCESNNGPEVAIVLVFADDTEHAFVIASSED